MTNISRGLLIMALGIAFMSAMDATIKHLTDQMTVIQVVFFRTLFGVLPLFVIGVRQKKLIHSLKTKRPLLHFARGCLGILALGSFTLGLRDMSLANGLAICFAAPFFMLAFSTLLIGEKIGLHRIGAVIVGFMGIVVILQPDEGVISSGSLYMLGCALFYALSQTLVRKYCASESALTFSLWATLVPFVLSGLALPFFWHEITLELLGWAIFMGAIGGLGHYFMTEAHRLAPPTVVSPMEYTALLWGAFFDWYIWQILPGYATLGGGIIIIASGIYILWREQITQKREGTLP